MKKYIILLLVTVSLATFANESVNHFQLETYRNKLQQDIQQLRADQKKVEADREIIRQDRIQIMRMQDEIKRERMQEKKNKAQLQENPALKNDWFTSLKTFIQRFYF